MPYFPLWSYLLRLFTGDDGLAGANLSASAALDASVGIDNVDVAFRDSLNRAVGQAGAASDTFVSNYVSHCKIKR